MNNSTFAVILLLCLLGMIVCSIFLDCKSHTCEAIIEAQKIEIAELKDKVYWLRQVNSNTLIMEQILTSEMLVELNALNEIIKREKESNAKKQ